MGIAVLFAKPAAALVAIIARGMFRCFATYGEGSLISFLLLFP